MVGLSSQNSPCKLGNTSFESSFLAISADPLLAEIDGFAAWNEPIGLGGIATLEDLYSTSELTKSSTLKYLMAVEALWKNLKWSCVIST